MWAQARATLDMKYVTPVSTIDRMGIDFSTMNDYVLVLILSSNCSVLCYISLFGTLPLKDPRSPLAMALAITETMHAMISVSIESATTSRF